MHVPPVGRHVAVALPLLLLFQVLPVGLYVGVARQEGAAPREHEALRLRTVTVDTLRGCARVHAAARQSPRCLHASGARVVRETIHAEQRAARRQHENPGIRDVDRVVLPENVR